METSGRMEVMSVEDGETLGSIPANPSFLISQQQQSSSRKYSNHTSNTMNG
eukprot:CAMPEP_0114385578 /NCGR_PEP_ID=MMETSP0102-20121206/6080_1 /TAXON_ID=38822 ORGANISM="Pteridomonas danica, Strain PT" /NCGR_SAMPLE_ID=MMETSP0102 /ASSEMBLY_ACC=CAM_ASM_000212 /LENGTH=50 /DNA_ID=CAMNT_0001542181 /DNA_START=483 /DNA_END=631 /DNA_ORIENTATION=+